MTEETTASSRNPPRPRAGWIANGAALLARIGADARDDEELRQKKALLVAARHPDPARFRRVGQPLPRLRLAGRRRSVRLLRRLARLVGGLRANPTLPASPGHATPRHPVDDDSRADADRRVPCFRRGRVVGHPGSARSARLPRGASGCPLVRCLPHGLPAHRPRGRGVRSRTRISRFRSRARCWR